MSLTTIEEINKKIPLLISIGMDMDKAWGEMMTLQKTKENEIDEKKKQKIKEEQDELVILLRQYAAEIEHLGGRVEHFSGAYISFPGVKHGRQVCLSLKATEEKAVKYYHDIDETYIFRKPFNS